MKYTNPEIPEGINTSKDHPLKEFILLLVGVISSITVLVLLLILLSDFIVGFIPYEWEERLSYPLLFESENKNSNKTDKQIELYLQQLADRISVAQDLPQGMDIKVHYLDDDTVNAYAMLDGHIYFYRGLLEKLPNENALAMVIAHEIAHIKYRHPIHSLGRGFTIALVLSVINSSIGDSLMQNFINEAGYLTAIKYNRDMEKESDDSAMQVLLSFYGHLEGADDLFKVLQQASNDEYTIEFFSTHPLTENRISKIQNRIATAGKTASASASPLPELFSSWIKAEKKNPQ